MNHTFYFQIEFKSDIKEKSMNKYEKCLLFLFESLKILVTSFYWVSNGALFCMNWNSSSVKSSQIQWQIQSGSGITLTLKTSSINMKAFELYVLDLFLNIQKQFPSSCHNQVLAQIRQVYAPIQWPLMVPEDQQHYYDLESKTWRFYEILLRLILMLRFLS